MSRRMTARSFLIAVCVLRVNCPPGVTQVEKTYSFCDGDVKIPMDPKCDTTFLIRNNAFARVTKNITEVMSPFKFLRGEGTMQILEGVNFTHRSLCELPDDLEEEVLTHYRASPCSRPNDGAALQGRPLAVLLGVALVFVMFV